MQTQSMPATVICEDAYRLDIGPSIVNQLSWDWSVPIWDLLNEE